MAQTITFEKFVDYVPTLFPSWLRAKWGRRFAQAIGLTLDGLAQGAKDAIYARFVRIAPADALQYIGEERGIFRFPSEGTESYRQRIIKAWDTWELAATPAGIVAGLAAAGYTAIVHECRKNVDARPNVWDRPDRNPARWPEFWVELPVGGHDFGTGATWDVGDGSLVGLPLVVGFDIPAPIIIPKLNLIRKIIKTWKGPHARFKEIVVVLSGTLVGDFVVGDGTTLGCEARYVSPDIDPTY